MGTPPRRLAPPSASRRAARCPPLPPHEGRKRPPQAHRSRRARATTMSRPHTESRPYGDKSENKQSAVEETRTMATILVVEDNDENWDMISRRLQRRGYLVVRAADGQEAVEMAARERPDLILMDVSLPVMDGLEATRRIRAQAETQTTPIIALTAHAMSGDRDRALQAGCDDYHTKPVELPRLLAQMEALLTKEATA